MKVRVTMKDPDGAYDSVNEAVDRSLQAIRGSLSARELEAVRERRTEEARAKLGRWMKYGEYLTVEFDLEAMTATVAEET